MYKNELDYAVLIYGHSIEPCFHKFDFSGIFLQRYGF